MKHISTFTVNLKQIDVFRSFDHQYFIDYAQVLPMLSSNAILAANACKLMNYIIEPRTSIDSMREIKFLISQSDLKIIAEQYPTSDCLSKNLFDHIDKLQIDKQTIKQVTVEGVPQSPKVNGVIETNSDNATSKSVPTSTVQYIELQIKKIEIELKIKKYELEIAKLNDELAKLNH